MAYAIADEAIRSTETRTFNGGGCPTEWLLEKVDEAQNIEVLKSFFIYGELGHDAIDMVLSGASLDEALEFLWASEEATGYWEKDWIETKNRNKENLLGGLNAMMYRWAEQYAEYYDGTFYTDEVELMLDFETPNGTHVRTRIDALFRTHDGDRPVLVDWKLGTSKSGKAMQLYVYWYGLKKMGIVTEDDYFRAWFHYVEYADPIGLVHEYPGDEIVEAYIDEADRRRKAGPYLPNPEWVSCNYCAYKDDMCPLYASEPQETWKYITEVEVYFV